MKKAALYLLLGITLVVLFTSCAGEKSSSISQPVVFSSVEGKEWVEECIEHYPEILLLADEKARKTEEGQAILQGTYSEQLFGQKFIEFDRTMMTLHCLRLILDGSEKSYALFTAAQSNDNKLAYKSFQQLHLEGQQLLKSKWKGLSESEIATAMETALVLGDIGKSEKAREMYKPYGISAPDHDDFHGEVMRVLEKHPGLSASFNKLSPDAKELLIKTANLAHYGHITHLEGGTLMFRELKKSALPSKDPFALSFDLFVHTCDVAGALGHVNNQSSLVYTESAHRAMQAMWDAIKVLSNPQKTELDAYNTYLSVRAAWLGLSSEDRTDRVLTRIGAMLRLFTPEEGVILRNAMIELSEETRGRIVAQLDIQQDDLSSRTPTYMPALLVNLSNNNLLGDSKEERLQQAIQVGLPFIAKVLEKHRELLANDEIDPNIPLNFNHMAGIAKTTPDLLAKEFYIDKEGNVRLANSAN